MKVWIVQRNTYDYEGYWVTIVAAYDTEEKAIAHVALEEAKERQRQDDIDRCERCSLINEINHYVSCCYEQNIKPDKHKIDAAVSEFMEDNDCPCAIIPWLDEDYSEGVACKTGNKLSRDDYYSYTYKVIPMEVQ